MDQRLPSVTKDQSLRMTKNCIMCWCNGLQRSLNRRIKGNRRRSRSDLNRYRASRKPEYNKKLKTGAKCPFPPRAPSSNETHPKRCSRRRPARSNPNGKPRIAPPPPPLSPASFQMQQQSSLLSTTTIAKKEKMRRVLSRGWRREGRGRSSSGTCRSKEMRKRRSGGGERSRRLDPRRVIEF